MISWIIVVAIAALLSYLSDVGVLEILSQPVPFFGGSTISVILMLTCIMMLLRAVKMSRKGEKEILRDRVADLERELLEIRQSTPPSSAVPPKQDEN